MKVDKIKITVFLYLLLSIPSVASLPDMLVYKNNDSASEKVNGNSADLDSLPLDTLVHTLDEVVVAAFNRTQRLVEVPGSLTSLGAVLMDREKPDYNIFPLLNHAPGVFAHTGATNTSRVSIRGIGARVPYATGKIRAYFNNIPLTNTSGITFIQDIDPAVVESMEIIKGPATSVYGAGLGGTITMTARSPDARQTGVSNTSQVGSFGMFRNSIVTDLVRDNFASSLVYSHIQSDGYRQNNEFQRDVITSVSQYTLNEKTNFTGLFSFAGLKSHIPSSIDSITYMENPETAAANWFGTRGYEDSRRALGGITASHAFSDNLTSDISLFSVWHDEKEMRPFDVFYEERLTLGSRIKATYSQEFGKVQMDFISGGELFFDDYTFSNHENIGGEGVQGEQFSDNRERVNTYNVFLQTDAHINRINLSGGINLNYSNRNYTDLFHQGALNRSGKYNYGTIISPRLSANYLYYQRNSVFITLSHGFSPPSLDETLTPEGFVNPDIQPERSWNMEMGLRGSWQNGKLFYDFSIYQMQVRDLLVAERVGEDAWVGKNAGESLHRGLEAELHWMVYSDHSSAPLAWNELSVRTNYTLNNFRFTDFIDRGNDYSGYSIPGVPDQVFFIAWYAETGSGVYLMPSMRNVGSMAMNDSNTKFSETYNLVDAVIGLKRQIFSTWHMDLFFRVNNLFNEKYASMILVNAPSFGSAAPRYYYPGLPVNYTLGLKMQIIPF